MDIRIEHLTKTYGPQRAVDDISFEVNTGEIVGFLGPNGAGKTTTMKIITCYQSPDAGDVKVGGYSIHTHPQEIKRTIGYLPEQNPLYQDMHVIEYLEFVAELQNVEKSKIKNRTYDMIGLCGLDIEKHKKIGELSKGYKQRVGLAQAMIHDPEILILDEPTTGLDPNQIVEIRKLIKEVGKEKTVILSTHILPEVEATCDRILIINKGKITADGTAESLRKQAQGSEILRVQILEGASDQIISSLQGLESVAMVDPMASKQNYFEIQSTAEMSSKRAIFDLCVNNKWVLSEMTPIEQRLEEIFRDLTIN